MPPVTASTPISRYRDFKKARPNSVGMLLEGDSWFAFPMWLRTNLVAEIKSINKEKIVQLDYSSNGDEAREMMCSKQFEQMYQTLGDSTLQFDCILFSAGGNDIVGSNLPILLETYKAGMTWEDCLKLSRFNRRLQEIELAYRDLVDLRDDFQPNAWIFSHSYDYAIPSGKGVRILGLTAAGGWLQDVMNDKGIPPKIQQEIVDQMLSRFDDMVLRLSQTQRNWKHVRTQGTLADSEWRDELHPTSAGFKKVAAKFQAALVEVFPKLSQG